MRYSKVLGWIAISTLASILIQFFKRDLNFGVIIGGSIALFFAPFAIASLIQYGIRFSNWDYNNESFSKKYIIIWSIFFLLNLLGAFQ
jgi:hypothetical protein